MSNYTYRDKLVRMVQASGQYLLDNADDIVNAAALKRDLEIRINYEMGNIPEFTIIEKHYSREVMDIINGDTEK